MSRAMPKIPDGVFTEEQIAQISGGLETCTADQITIFINNLQQNYDTLVDFTSYVIETVTNSLSSGQ